MPESKSLKMLTANDIVSFIENFFALLESHQELINRLNVYPVPDGDTGTNMTLTIKSAITEVRKLPEKNPQDLIQAVAHGALMGARGNSGIIMCQILRSFLFALKFPAGIFEIQQGLAAAKQGAYSAVANPVEGTMITVISRAADCAESFVKAQQKDLDLLELLEKVRQASIDSLIETPKLLPILLSSNVVDAGGCGVVLFTDALVATVGGNPLGGLHSILPENVKSALSSAQIASNFDLESAADDKSDESSSSRYEVMFLLAAQDEAIKPFKEIWETLGDSIAIVGDHGLYNCHIHTSDIGSVIEAALDIGRPSRIRVTDLYQQIEEEKWVKTAQKQSEPSIEGSQKLKTAVIAVANGDGIKRIFQSLGVKAVITGGQTMNPSTGEILEAIKSINAEGIIVLPNNNNIIAVANEAAKASEKNVLIIDTENVIEGFAALLRYDPNADIDQNFSNMNEAKETVIYAEVVRAVREANTLAGHVDAGDWLGITRNGIEISAKQLPDLLCQLADKLIKKEHELVTVFEGHNAELWITRHFEAYISEKFPWIQVEIHKGDQPFYPYLISIE